MFSRILSSLFVCLLFVALISAHGKPPSHHGGGSNGGNHHQNNDSNESSCGDPCIKLSGLIPNRPGERILRGQCTVQSYYPVYGEHCTCFFNLGYYCYNVNVGTTAGTAATYTEATTASAATTAATTAAARTTAATTAGTTAATTAATPTTAT